MLTQEELIRDKIRAIKYLRSVTGCGLKEAKDQIDQVYATLQLFGINTVFTDQEIIQNQKDTIAGLEQELTNAKKWYRKALEHMDRDNLIELLKEI